MTKLRQVMTQRADGVTKYSLLHGSRDDAELIGCCFSHIQFSLHCDSVLPA
jgi:hypothetical protein